MLAPLTLLGGLVQALFSIFLLGVPIGLYIWLRAKGIFGEPSGKTFE